MPPTKTSSPSPRCCDHCGSPAPRRGTVCRDGRPAEHVFCSRACYDAHRVSAREARAFNPVRKRKISAAFTGAKHPNWRGGRWDLSYRGPNWQVQRVKVRQRDGYRCRDCGCTDEEARALYGRELDVDHLEPFHNFPNSRQANRVRNLITRCASCHRKAEAKRRGVQMTLGLEHRGHKGYARGEAVNTSKLTASQVFELRRRAAEGEPVLRLAKEFHISQSSADAIVKGRTWKHLLSASLPLRSSTVSSRSAT